MAGHSAWKNIKHKKAANDAKYDRLRHGYRPGHGRQTPLAQLPMRKIAVERLSGRAKGTPLTANSELQELVSR